MLLRRETDMTTGKITTKSARPQLLAALLSAAVAFSVFLTACSDEIKLAEIPDAAQRQTGGYWESTFTADTNGTVPEGYEKIAENDSLIFFFDKVNLLAIVRNKITGYDWMSDYLNDGGVALNDSWIRTLQSLFILSASDISLNNNVITTYTSADYNKKAKITPIKDGLSIEYLIDDINISLKIELSLDKYGLVYKIPESGIVEGVGVNEQIVTIKKELYDQIDLAIAELDKFYTIDGAQDLLEADARKFAASLRKIRQLLDPFETPKGIEYAIIQSEQVITDTTSILSGGESSVGFVKKLKNAGFSKKDITRCQSIANGVSGYLNVAIYAIGRLKKLKFGGVVSIAVMPFMGTSGDSDNGYVFYPDGSGVISRYSPNHPQYATYFSRGIYSDKTIYLDLEKERFKSGIMNTTIPVYGVNLDNNAFVAIADAGEEDADINFYPSGYQVSLNRISFEFNYRRQVKTTDTRSSVGQKVSNIIERDGNLRDCQVRFLFLDKNSNNYSGMANACRTFFLDQGTLVKSKKISEEIPLMLNILLNIKEQSILADSNVTMTSYAQVRDMIGYFQSAGIKKQYVNLLGWTENGYLRYPSGYKPAASLGGAAGLKALAGFTDENAVNLYLSDDYIDAQIKAKGFGMEQLAKHYNTTQIANISNNEFLFNPKVAISNLIYKALPRIADMPISGINFDKIGSLVYYDYNRLDKVKRQETVKAWIYMMEQSYLKFGGAAVSTGNLYSLRYADWVIDIPSGDTGYPFSSESVPFLQMLIHGVVQYTIEPFNQFHDKSFQKLQAIEYGAVPYYLLTYEDTIKLKDTESDTIFSSKYEDFREEAVAVTKEFSEKLGNLNDKYFVLHEKLSKDLVKVAYNDGTVIFINYGKSDLSVEGVQVGANDYIVVKGD